MAGRGSRATGAGAGPYDTSDPIVDGVLTGDRRAVSRLLSRGNSVNRVARDAIGNLFPLIVLALQTGDKEMLVLLLDRGAEINATGFNGSAALLAACVRGFLPIVQLLVERGALVNHAKNDGFTALMFACPVGFAQIVQFLLDHARAFVAPRDGGVFTCELGPENLPVFVSVTGATGDTNTWTSEGV